MKQYEKPLIYANEELSEGVYAHSGDTETVTKCDSIYMDGKFQEGTYNPIQDGYKKGRGCEGCPANWGTCKADIADHSTNNFKPSWEVAGFGPDQKGY